MEIKTLILAGGKGTRLNDLTVSVNKHLLPLGRWPVISYVFESVYNISDDILLITSPDEISRFARLIVSDVEPYNGHNTFYAAQQEPNGIADAIQCGKSFCGNSAVFVMLGDNIFNSSVEIWKVCNFLKQADNQEFGAHIWVTRSANPSLYGVLELNELDQPKSIEEKPNNPKSNLIITGAYLFDYNVWDIISDLKKSSRGEYEITDVLRAYLELKQLHHHEFSGKWYDVGGSIESYWRVAEHIKNSEISQGMML